jgi:hypothetical protein
MSDRQIMDIGGKSPDECLEYQREAQNRLESTLKSLDSKQEIRYAIPLGILLRAKGDFICCPHCYQKKRAIEPIRVGQFTRLNSGCRHEIKWTTHGDTNIRIDPISARTHLHQDSVNRAQRPKNMGKYSMFSRHRRTFELPTMKHRVRWDSKKESSDNTGLTYDLMVRGRWYPNMPAPLPGLPVGF